MGYERKSLQILGGGYNALPPVDKVPITDYLLAQNWRTDSLGRLTSRGGYVSKFSIPGAGLAHSAGSAGGPTSPYYVGCNSAIADPTSAVYFDGNPAAIATGFDGFRIGFAFQNGFAYIMNRGNQLRHSAAGGPEAWNLSAPPASPTAAAGSSPSPIANVTYTYDLVGDPAYVHFLTIAGTTYSIAENGYSAPQIPLVLSLIAANDPNCSVTYDGTSQNIVITPIIPNTLMPVSGSDGNASVNLATGGVSSLPNGTYQYYLTFMSADFTLESNPSPASAIVTVVSQPIAVAIPVADAPADLRIGFVNVYRTGGTQGNAYRVGQVASTVASPATAFLDSMSDLQATNNGQVLAITHDAPPACSGIIGPFLSRLYAWSTFANVNRLFYTPINQPQYWNTDPQVGDWVDAGLDGEAIVWCAIHSNIIVIYKERSIWLLIGDPLTGTLEQIYDGIGLANAFGLAPAGQIDYFIGPNGLYLFDMSEVHEITGNVLPLFNQSIENAGPLTPPGSVQPGGFFNSGSTSCYAIAIGHALGRLYIAYAEQGTGNYNLLVEDEGPEPETQAFIARRPGRWFYQRNAIAGTIGGFFGFFFDGISMVGLTGAIDGGAAQGFSLSDFRGFLASDPGPTPIECVYQSHYEDDGQPDNEKMWLEVVIDYEFAAGASADVYAGFSNGVIAPALVGTLAAGARQTLNFSLEVFAQGEDPGVLAKNMSVLIDVTASGVAILHNVYLFFYVEARVALVASTLPTDLGVGKEKECKELQLDIAVPAGTVGVNVLSDLPGNALAVRADPVVAAGGRAILKYPFATCAGLLWQVSLAGNAGATFRLYGVRLLMRVIGVFVEGYESAAGFLWDSMQQDVTGDGTDKTFDQARFEMDAQGPVSVQVLTDLPGEAFGVRGGGAFVLTTAATSRAWVTVPLPPGIEGRSVQVRVLGPSGYRLYKVQVRYGRVGRYLMGTAPNTLQDAFNTLEFDYATEYRKMFKRIEIDLRADGVVNLNVITDQDGDKLQPVYAPAISTPNGRTTVMLPMPPGIRGRLLRLQLSGPAPARIYRIRVWTRTVGESGAWKWEDFPIEESNIVPTWADLVVEETPPVWKLVDVDFSVASS